MLKTRVITALVLLAIISAVLFSQSFLAMICLAGLFFAAAIWENFRLFGSRYPLVGAMIWTAGFCVAVFKADGADVNLVFALCVLIWALRLVPSLAFGLPTLDSFRNRMLNGLYGIAILGCFIAIVVLFKRSPQYLLSVMAIVWIADIGAYFSGKAFGQHKLAPSVSPGKSWEGAIGGWLAVLAATAASTAIPALHNTFAAVIFGKWGGFRFVLIMTVLTAASIVGDLFESQLKRRADMKDSSNLLPGHGGMLDRIDALIPVLPLAALLSL